MAEFLPGFLLFGISLLSSLFTSLSASNASGSFPPISIPPGFRSPGPHLFSYFFFFVGLIRFEISMFSRMQIAPQQGQPKKSPVEFDHAITYVNKIKVCFSRSTHLSHFLTVPPPSIDEISVPTRNIQELLGYSSCVPERAEINQRGTLSCPAITIHPSHFFLLLLLPRFTTRWPISSTHTPIYWRSLPSFCQKLALLTSRA